MTEIYTGFLDHPTFCRESLAIADKFGRTVDFICQPAQLMLDRAIEKCREDGKPARILFLKARQVMVSTGVASEFFRRVPFRSGQKALIVAHEKDAARNIFSYYRQLLDNYKPFRGQVKLPGVDNDAKAAGYLKFSNGSYFRIQSANNLDTGRSYSLRYLHLSEYAFWRDARTLMTGLMQAVPDDADTIVIIESTANGASGDFYQKWKEATDPSSGSEWTALFFAWWMHPEYVRAIADPAAFQDSLSQDEREMRERYGLSLQQLHWRRWAIVAKCQKSVDVFKQEYPSNPEEAFLFSGRPRFCHRSLAKMPVRDGLAGELFRHTEHGGVKKPLVFLPNEDGKGALIIYRRPSKGKRYVIGVDVAEGIDATEASRHASGTAHDPDYSVACVLDGDTGEQIAKLRGRIEPGPFSEYLAALAEWFNFAFIVPEANAVGIALLEGLLREDYPPGLIYKRRPDPAEQFHPNAYTSLHYLGWKTNAATRVQMISGLDMAIREFGVTIVDAQTVQECRNFVIKANGRQEAQDGDHDDEVIAIALAVVGLAAQPADRRLLGLAPDSAVAKRPVAPGGTVRKYGERRLEGRGNLTRQ